MALHYFDVDVAKRCGVNAAILLSDIQYWCERSKGDPAHLREGRVWMWSSVRDFRERHPYLTARQIRYALEQLTAAEVVITAQYSDRALDRTIWYSPVDLTPVANAFDNSGKCIGQQCQMQMTPVANAFDKSGVPTTIHYRETLENTIEPNRDNVGGNRYVSPPSVVVRGEDENISHPTIDQAREYARAACLREWMRKPLSEPTRRRAGRTRRAGRSETGSCGCRGMRPSIRPVWARNGRDTSWSLSEQGGKQWNQ